MVSCRGSDRDRSIGSADSDMIPQLNRKAILERLGKLGVEISEAWEYHRCRGMNSLEEVLVLTCPLSSA